MIVEDSDQGKGNLKGLEVMWGFQLREGTTWGFQSRCAWSYTWARMQWQHQTKDSNLEINKQ